MKISGNRKGGVKKWAFEPGKAVFLTDNLN
jgi:hypothetical protein